MDNVEKYSDSYEFIINHFTEKKIVARYAWLYEKIKTEHSTVTVIRPLNALFYIYPLNIIPV